MCTYINVLVTLQVPSLSPGAQRAGKGKVEYPPCSTSKLKIVFGILPWIFRVKEEKISTSIMVLENKSQEASKAKRCFWGWCLASMGPCQVPCWVLTGSSQRLASCPHLSFCHAQGDKQQQAGLKGDFLHSAAKTIISSCFPATCQKWFIGTGMGQTGGGTSGARAFYWYVLLCSQVFWRSCALLGVASHSWCVCGSSVLIRKGMTVKIFLGWMCTSSYWVTHWNIQCLNSDEWPVEPGKYIFAKILLADV